jgi:putative spermidine/putrescine transport system permease protein
LLRALDPKKRLRRLIAVGLVARHCRFIGETLALIHNELVTIVATVHILLPFMIIPLYSVMQKIPRDLLPATASLGASPSYPFASASTSRRTCWAAAR